MFRTYFTTESGTETHATTAGTDALDVERALRWANGSKIVINRHVRVCNDCNAECKPLPGSMGTGYAISADNTFFLCYACADNRQRAEMLDRSRPFGCYISGDGKRATTWTGGKLGDVVQSGVGGGFGGRMLHVRVRDVHGGMWYGKGAGVGMCITLRAMKGSR